jgi:hypothetical protein
MDYVWQFLLFIVAGLVLNRIEEIWARKKEDKNRPAKLRKDCIEKIRHCVTAPSPLGEGAVTQPLL